MASNTSFSDLAKQPVDMAVFATSMADAVKTIPVTATPTDLPVSGGTRRQTTPDGVVTFGGWLNELSLINPDFPIQFLEGLEYLAKFHADVSYAVDNIVQLGNTPYKVTFDQGVSDADAKKMNARIKEKSRSLYSFSGGLNSLINDLLAQACISGAISAEIVPENNLQGVRKAVLVTAKSIRFTYDAAKDDYIPLQIPYNGSFIPTDNPIGTKLNTTTYKYIAYRRFNERPYAIPPFLSALFNVNIDKNILNNFEYVIKKMGILGFLEVLVNAPQKLQGETDDAYYKRTQDYLVRVVPEIEKGLNKGYAVGFKNLQEFKLHNTTGNVQGAKELLEMNDVKMMAGLKQDPLMFGRNFSVTETLGRVILAKMTSQVGNYQMLVASFLEDLFLLDLQLQGFKVKSTEVKFEPPMVGDELRAMQALNQKIDAYDKLYAQGVIGQTQRANALGYEEADEEEPRMEYINPADPNTDAGTDATTPKKQDVTKNRRTVVNNKLSISDLIAIQYGRLTRSTPEFHYDICPGCEGSDRTMIQNAKKKLDKVEQSVEGFTQAYFNASFDIFKQAVNDSVETIADALASLGEGATEQQIADLVIYNLYKNWNKYFISQEKDVIDRFVNDAYRFFRKDKTLFTTKDGVPNGAFTTIDYRAMDYYKNIDAFYLGRFITDADLKKQIYSYIKDEYLTRNRSLYDNDAIQHFKDTFPDVLNGQDWKISRVITTSVNKMRNSAAVNYFDQAGVEQYSIVGINDIKQCAYCAAMQGKVFSVSRSVDFMRQAFSSDPEAIKYDSPFLTSVFKDPKELANFTGDQLQDKSIYFPPFHSFCRDQAVPIL